VQALTLVEYGRSHPKAHINGTIASEQSGISKQSVSNLRSIARERGYDPAVSTEIKAEYVADAPKSGRPPTIPAGSDLETAILAAIESGNRNAREKQAGKMAFEHAIGTGVMLRFLKKHGYKPCKTTKTPGLNEKMRAARLEFCQLYRHWTLEDWKNVIWTDETSVVLNARRGGRLRVWRKANERFLKPVTRVCYKGFSEFIFWGCFSYERKGPMHCWKTETVKEKKAATKELERVNLALEPFMREIWDRLQAEIDARPGRRRGRGPEWKWDEAHGKIVRDSTGGIDWYRYQKVR
jgi:hypothetical protein